VELVASSVTQVSLTLELIIVELTKVKVSPATSVAGLAAVPPISDIAPYQLETPEPGKTKITVLPPPTAVVTINSYVVPTLAVLSAGILTTISPVPSTVKRVPDSALVRVSVTAPPVLKVELSTV